MESTNENLHGSAPDKSSVALLLIDVINDLEFPEADQLLPHALAMARQIASFRRRAKEQKVPVIYVNDNFGAGDRTSTLRSNTAFGTACEASQSWKCYDPMRTITSS